MLGCVFVPCVGYPRGKKGHPAQALAPESCAEVAQHGIQCSREVRKAPEKP